jgi:TonB family protein
MLSSLTTGSRWHRPCFSVLGACAFNGEGVLENRRFHGIVVALTLTLRGSAPLIPRIGAEEKSSDNAKRKIRTRVAPDYPDIAKRNNLAGKVKVEATIAPDGRVTATRVVGGSPLLVNCASEALRKWRYEPAQ